MQYDSLLQDEVKKFNTNKIPNKKKFNNKENRESIREWISKTFTRRECVYFVASKTYSDK